jgi:hypothetical protein
MTNRHLSQSAFAKMLGVTSQAIVKIKDQLTWVTIEGKKKPLVDIQGVKTLRYISEREKKIKNDPSAFHSTTKSNEKKEAPPKQKIIYPVSDQDNDEPSLKEIKTQEEIEKLRIANRQNRGKLIDKRIVKKVFDRLHTIDQNQLKTLGVTASPKISSVYNDGNKIKADRLIKELLKYGTLTTTSILNILNQGEDDRINQANQILEDAIGDILVAIQKEINKFIKYTDELEAAASDEQ